MLIEIREMVSFELSKEIKKDVFHPVTSIGQRKNWVPTRKQTSDLRIPHSDALPLSHRDSTVSEVYYFVPYLWQDEKHLSLKSYVVCWISWIHIKKEKINFQILHTTFSLFPALIMWPYLSLIWSVSGKMIRNWGKKKLMWAKIMGLGCSGQNYHQPFNSKI